jgi:putative transcriptional regulator
MTARKPLVINQPEVSKPVSELRLLTGLTQEQFATSLGVTYPTINRWENGRAKPSSLVMEKIKAHLHEMGDHGKDLKHKYFSEYKSRARLVFKMQILYA